MLRALTCCLVFLAACGAENGETERTRPEVTHLIKNALIIDGSGADGFRGAVRFSQGGIVAVGDLDPIETDEILATRPSSSQAESRTASRGVWVNGERVWRDHRATGAYPGKFLGRAQ